MSATLPFRLSRLKKFGIPPTWDSSLRIEVPRRAERHPLWRPGYTLPVKTLRTATALFLGTALLLLLGTPVCSSSACPMNAAERAVCKAMGRDCCGTQGGPTAHGSVAPAPDLAVAPAALAASTPTLATDVFHPPTGPDAAPAVIQGVGLFTLLAVFLI